jgi:4a-hydroxytetrahydrobiopterin dehydratase
MPETCALADRVCEPCQGGVPPLEETAAITLLSELGGGWTINDSGHLERLYTFDNFIQAMNFANQVGDVAEEAGHHPDLHIGWGRCGLEIWTHKINGLAEADFVLAAKAKRIYEDGL